MKGAAGPAAAAASADEQKKGLGIANLERSDLSYSSTVTGRHQLLLLLLLLRPSVAVVVKEVDVWLDRLANRPGRMRNEPLVSWKSSPPETLTLAVRLAG